MAEGVKEFLPKNVVAMFILSFIFLRVCLFFFSGSESVNGFFFSGSESVNGFFLSGSESVNGFF